MQAGGGGVRNRELYIYLFYAKRQPQAEQPEEKTKRHNMKERNRTKAKHPSDSPERLQPSLCLGE